LIFHDLGKEKGVERLTGSDWGTVEWYKPTWTDKKKKQSESLASGVSTRQFVSNLPIERGLCERNEAISVYYNEIAAHPLAVRNDSSIMHLRSLAASLGLWASEIHRRLFTREGRTCVFGAIFPSFYRER